MDRGVFKEEVALGLAGCVESKWSGVRAPLALLGLESYALPSSCCGRSVLSGSQEPLLGSFFLLAEVPQCQEQEEGLLPTLPCFLPIVNRVVA